MHRVAAALLTLLLGVGTGCGGSGAEYLVAVYADVGDEVAYAHVQNGDARCPLVASDCTQGPTRAEFFVARQAGERVVDDRRVAELEGAFPRSYGRLYYFASQRRLFIAYPAYGRVHVVDVDTGALTNWDFEPFEWAIPDRPGRQLALLDEPSVGRTRLRLVDAATGALVRTEVVPMFIDRVGTFSMAANIHPAAWTEDGWLAVVGEGVPQREPVAWALAPGAPMQIRLEDVPCATASASGPARPGYVLPDGWTARPPVRPFAVPTGPCAP